jgi:hypothetical protein
LHNNTNEWKKKFKPTPEVKKLLQYFQFLDQHISDVVEGKASEFMELNQIASELAISHQHLTDTIKKRNG